MEHLIFRHAGIDTCKKCGTFGKGLDGASCVGTLTQEDWNRFAEQEKEDARSWTRYALDNPEVPVHE